MQVQAICSVQVQAVCLVQVQAVCLVQVQAICSVQVQAVCSVQVQAICPVQVQAICPVQVQARCTVQVELWIMNGDHNCWMVIRVVQNTDVVLWSWDLCTSHLICTTLMIISSYTYEAKICRNTPVYPVNLRCLARSGRWRQRSSKWLGMLVIMLWTRCQVLVSHLHNSWILNHSNGYG